MAYMNQEKKAKIASALKAVVPADWKYSLAVRDHSTIVLTIKSAPIDLLEHVEFTRKSHHDDAHIPTGTYHNVNKYYLERQFSGDILQVMQNILDALNTGNHDNGDIQSDYYDVGHHIDWSIGRWNKPFVVVPAKSAKPASPVKQVIKPSTRLRVIINGVMLHNVSENELERMLGVTSHRQAVNWAVYTFNKSPDAITGFSGRLNDVDIQIDLR